MNAIEESRLIGEAVAATFRDSGLIWPPETIGPIPLAEMISCHSIVHEEVDGLNRAAASAVLRRWDIRWSAIPRQDPPLAGFIYARGRPKGRSGYIFVRRDDILPRRRFTAAHELGHFRLHLDADPSREAAEMVEADAESDVEESGQAELAVMERQANRFAAELLMPEPICRDLHDRYERKYGQIDRFLVYHLAADLLVSRSAIAWRLFSLGLIKRPSWLGQAADTPRSSQAMEVGDGP